MYLSEDEGNSICGLPEAGVKEWGQSTGGKGVECIRTVQHVVHALVPPPPTGHCGITTVCQNNMSGWNRASGQYSTYSMHLFPHHRLVTVELQQCVRTTCQVGTEHEDGTAHSPCACSPTTDWSLWNYNSVSEQHVWLEQSIRMVQHIVHALVPPPPTGHCGITTVCQNNMSGWNRASGWYST